MEMKKLNGKWKTKWKTKTCFRKLNGFLKLNVLEN